MSSSSRFLTAYVDIPFIEELMANKPESGLDMADRKDISPGIWRGVCQFLRRNARMIVDVDEDTLDSRPLIKGFLFQTGQFNVDLQPEVTKRLANPEQIHIEDPYTLFLMESPEISVEDLRRQTGLLFLRHSDLEHNWLRLFKQHEIDVWAEASEAFEWSHLQQHGCPLNALIVADKYAYNQFEKDTFEENLGALLLSLLPDRVDNSVHITLITDLWTAYEQKEISPNKIHDRIEDHLNIHRPNLDLSVTVLGYKQGSGHKDRFIITNYAWFTSNDSFDFFKGETLEKDTLVFHLPLSKNSSMFRRRLKRLASICKDPPEYPVGNLLLASGSAENRLLDRFAKSS